MEEVSAQKLSLYGCFCLLNLRAFRQIITVLSMVRIVSQQELMVMERKVTAEETQFSLVALILSCQHLSYNGFVKWHYFRCYAPGMSHHCLCLSSISDHEVRFQVLK